MAWLQPQLARERPDTFEQTVRVGKKDILQSRGGPYISAVNLLQGLDRHFAFGDHVLELGILGFQGTKTLDLGRVEGNEFLAPDIDRLLAELVLARDLGDRTRPRHGPSGRPGAGHALEPRRLQFCVHAHRWLISWSTASRGRS